MKKIVLVLASAAAVFSLAACDLDDYDDGYRGHHHHHGDRDGDRGDHHGGGDHDDGGHHRGHH